MKKKSRPSIPPPAWATVPASPRLKRSTAPKRSTFNPKGARPSPWKTAVRLAAIAESQREGDRIAKERSLKREYAKFYATKEGRAFAKEFGKSAIGETCRASAPACRGDIEFRDPAEIPDSVGCGSHNGRKLVSLGEHPVDFIEPAPDSSVEIELLSDAEIKATSSTFEAILRWALEGESLVGKGERTLVLIGKLRADIVYGMELDARATAAFNSAIRISNSALANAGNVFARVLEWMRRGGDVANYGERLYLVTYALRPELIDAATLAKLGAMAGKTRQAKDKGANCLRDTINGIKALAMRGDITRIRCKAAQLAA